MTKQWFFFCFDFMRKIISNIFNYSFVCLILLLSCVVVFSLNGCTGCNNPGNNAATINSPKQSAKIKFHQGVGVSYGCTYLDGQNHNLQKVIIQVKSGQLKPGGNPASISDWNLVDLGDPIVFARIPGPGQQQINADGTVTMDIPVEGLMSLEAISILDCNECCGNGASHGLKCTNSFYGKPVFKGTMQPASYRNVSGLELWIPLDFSFCACEC